MGLGEGINTRRSGKEGEVDQVVVVKLAEAAKLSRLAKVVQKPVTIECMKCRVWFNVEDLDCMEDKSVSEMEKWTSGAATA